VRALIAAHEGTIVLVPSARGRRSGSSCRSVPASAPPRGR